MMDDPDMSPLVKERRTTNSKSLVIFAVLMIIYIGTAIYAFSSGTINNDPSENIKDDLKINFNKILRELNESKWFFLGFFIFSILLIVLSLLIVRSISRIVLTISIVLDCLILVSFVMNSLRGLFVLDLATYVVLLMSYAILSYIIFVRIHILVKVGTDLVSVIIKESCRVIFHFPLAILLSTAALLLSSLVGIFMILVAVFLASLGTGGTMPFHIVLFHGVNICAGLWLICFLLYFAQMVFYGTFGTWYWTMNKALVPGNTLLKNMSLVLRYHIGTIAYASSFWSFIPLIFIMISGIRRRVRDSSHSILILIPCWLNIYFRLFDASAGAAAIHGESFKKSAKIACQLYCRHPLRYFAITMGQAICTQLFAIISIIAVFIFYAIFADNLTSDEYNYKVGIALVVSILFLILPMVMILSTSVNAVTFCTLQDLELNQQNNNRMCFMKAKLRDLLM